MKAETNLAKRAIQALNGKGLQVIQFKSSGRLQESYAGMTDFDLVVPTDHFNIACDTLLDLGFLERSTNDPAHPAQIRDFIGYDQASRAIHHFSLHAELVFGAKPIKRHVVPQNIWRNFKTEATSEGLKILQPVEELLLLTLRLSLRIRIFSFRTINWLIRGSDSRFPEKAMLKEARRLHQFSPLSGSHPEIPGGFSPVLEKSAASLITVLSQPQIRRGSFLFGMVRLRIALNSWIALRGARLMKIRLQRLTFLENKAVRSAGAGLAVAVVGIDGSGKSSLVEHLTDWLDYKFSAKSFYLGQHKKSASQRLLRFMNRVGRQLRIPLVRNLSYRLARVDLERLRWKESWKIQKWTARGGIAVVDRWPLREFRNSATKMDSPVLGSTSVLGKLETHFSNLIPHYPDYLIVLSIDPVLAGERKSGDPKVLEGKANSIKALLQSNIGTIFRVVSSNEPLEENKTQSEKFVWAVLTRLSRRGNQPTFFAGNN